MRRISRYVIAEFLKVFVCWLVGLTTLITFGLILVEGLKEGLAPGSLLLLLPFSLPLALIFTIPATTLFAVCSIYSRMSSANEIVAIKSAGISPMATVWPVLVVTLALSCLVVWLNDVAVSWGRLGMQRVFFEAVEQNVYAKLRSKKSFSTPKCSFTVRSVEGHRLLNPVVMFQKGAGESPTTITAEEAELVSEPGRGVLRIVLRDCKIDMGRRGRSFWPDTFEQEIPLETLLRRGSDTDRPAVTALRQIPSEVAAQREQIEQWERTFATEAALQMLTGDFGALTSTDWNSRHAQIQNGIARLHRLNTEPWRRAANGFSCLCFALVGAPLAIRLRSDVWTTFGLCFLPILVVYYPLMMYGADLAKSGDMPPYIAWMGNLVLAAVGYLQMRKIIRY